MEGKSRRLFYNYRLFALPITTFPERNVPLFYSEILIYTQMITMRFAITDSRKKMQINPPRALRADNFILDFFFCYRYVHSIFLSTTPPPPAALRSRVILTSITYVSLHVHTDININNE